MKIPFTIIDTGEEYLYIEAPSINVATQGIDRKDACKMLIEAIELLFEAAFPDDGSIHLELHYVDGVDEGYLVCNDDKFLSFVERRTHEER